MNSFSDSNRAIDMLTFRHHWTRVVLPCIVLCTVSARADWVEVYSESFDGLSDGTRTISNALPDWEGGSAAGVVFDGKTKTAGKFLIAASAWTSFNQGPIFNLDLSSTPHDRVRVSFDLYAFGDWRGLQRSTGGPQHRLMFFDNKANPGFSFDTNFSTNAAFKQSWPSRNPTENKAGTGATVVDIDKTGRFGKAHRWPIHFEYASDSPSLRFTFLCGSAAGSGKPMPRFGIDNVRVSVRSTAPMISPADRPEEDRLATKSKPAERSTEIRFELKNAGRASLGVFDRASGQLVRTLLQGEQLSAGMHAASWDGLDNRGNPAKAGQYEWRLVSSPGFTARYITTIGINPPGGENPVPRYSWVGDHVGAGIVDADESGVYIGSPLTEGMMMLVKADAVMSKIEWTRPQFYQSGQLRRAATSGKHVYMLHPNGKLRRLNRDNGHVEAEWQVDWDGVAPSDIDARGENLVVTYSEKNTIRWLSTATGQAVADVSVPNPKCVAVIGSRQKGEALVSVGRDIYLVRPGNQPRKVATPVGDIGAMDYDLERKELWAVVNGHKVVRLDSAYKSEQSYSEQARELGPFVPTRFAGVYDIAADLKGGFFIGEPNQAPRRIAHIARDGALIDQWFGGMSFYVGGTFDPDDPTRLYGIAPEGWVNVYEIDYEAGTWEIEACYATGRLGDSLFPNAAAFRAIRRNGELFLYHRVVPAVLRLDPKLRKAVPVAIAGRVINQGRTFFQFAGTGRDGYPKPWVAAAEHHGFKELKEAPKLYSWADTDGDGEFDPSEFRFYSDVKHSISFHNPGDFAGNGDYLGSAGTNQPHALVRLPVARWEGPSKDAPRWDWSKTEAAGEIRADSYGYGSQRGLSVGPDDSVTVAYQAGIMIREHGQYEGGGWPEAALRGSRILGFDAALRPQFAVGRQSKNGAEANTGVLFYPMQTTAGPNKSVIVNDQTKQPAQVWTHDGLYVGGFFDNRTDDGLADGFYQVHGDDNQGATVVTAKSGKTYWLMPYVGHNRLYEISGWDAWHRQSGSVSRPNRVAGRSNKGSGLTARYYDGAKMVFETLEAPIYYERFGGEPHADKVTPPYKAVWSGFVEPPVSDRFQFNSLLGANEQVAVSIDGKIIYAAGIAENVNNEVSLIAGHRHHIRIEYVNPNDRAELILLWSSRVTDPGRLPKEALYPDRR